MRADFYGCSSGNVKNFDYTKVTEDILTIKYYSRKFTVEIQFMAIVFFCGPVVVALANINTCLKEVAFDLI